MKHYLPFYLCTSILCLFSLGAISQTSYLLTASADSYTPLVTTNLLDESNPDSLSNPLYSYAVYQSIPIGFDFEFLGVSYDSLRMCEDGFVMFWNSNVKEGYISIFDCDLDNFSDNPALSPIYYSLEGTPGNRIFKLEIVNSGFANDINDVFYANAQLWLYENCNDFEVRIGSSDSAPNMFWNSYSSPYVGYGSYIVNDQASLTGNPLNPTLQQNSTTSMISVPGTGMVYQFSNCTANLQTHSMQSMRIYPNPANNLITVTIPENSTNGSLSIHNIHGELMIHMDTSNEHEFLLSLEDFPNGIYTVQIRSNRGVETQRIVKQ